MRTQTKDPVLALFEAVRLARLELGCYRDPECRASAEWTVDRLGDLLERREVSEAMRNLEEAPSIVPDASLDLRVPYPWRSH